MRNSRGFTITFSWIFSIIAGIIIFLFFAYFAVQHTDLFGKLTAQRAAEELDIVFTGIKSGVSETSLNFGKNVKMEFKCFNPTGRGYFEKVYINGKGGKTLKGKIVFAPSEMDSASYDVWTLDWNAPFKITNFIFLGDGRKYDIPDYLLEFIPYTFEGGVENRILDIDHPGIRFDPEIKEYSGTIQWKLPSGDKEYDFVGTAMIFAAIFSENHDKFKCMYEIAKTRANTIGKLYYEKYRNIQNCRISTNVLSERDFQNLMKIENAVKIKEENDKLLNNGCEGIY